MVVHVNRIDTGSVHCASGARNFFGEGYFKDLLPGGASWKRSTLVTKTTTIKAREGNMPLIKDDRPPGWLLTQYIPGMPALFAATQPKDWFPDCIWWNLDGDVVNSVSLSGPGAEALFQSGKWQAHLEAGNVLIISFMSVKKGYAERQAEWHEFVRLLKKYIPKNLWTRLVIQKNYSCPNTSRDTTNVEHLFDEVDEDSIFLAFETDGIVGFMPKFSVTTDPALAAKIAELPHVHAICISNTIPWGHMVTWLDESQRRLQVFWPSIYGDIASPLPQILDEAGEPFDPPQYKYGKGGLSGPCLRPLVREWVKRFRELNKIIHLSVGGGIFKFEHAKVYIDLGADSVFLGTVGMMRPWRVQPIIDRVNGYMWSEQARYRDLARDMVSDVKNKFVSAFKRAA